jgi:hypothetical protein
MMMMALDQHTYLMMMMMMMMMMMALDQHTYLMMMMMMALDQHTYLDLYSASSLKQRSMGRQTNTNYIVFGLTQLGLELTIYHTGEIFQSNISVYP